VERRRAAAAIDQGADSDDGTATGAHALDHLTGRAASGDDVLDDEAALARREREAAPQPHRAVLPLGEQRADAERARDLVGDQDAADGWRQHRLSPRVG